MKQLFDDEPVEKRAQLLEDNCVKFENEPVKRYFTEEEKTSFKNQLSEISIEQQDAERIKAAALKEYGANINILDKQRREILDSLKDGYTLTDERLYAFDDQAEGIMEYYDAQGIFVHSRKLLLSERQVRVIDMNQRQAK